LFFTSLRFFQTNYLKPALPNALLIALQGIPGFQEASFREVHETGEQITSIRINPARAIPTSFTDTLGQQVPWSGNGYYLNTRPSFTFNPLFHAGSYYVQEASSMFLEQALVQTLNIADSLRILDLCAAPGGKSTLIQSLIAPESLLVSNEVIKSRAAILEENIIKWGAVNTVVCNNDPSHFSRLEHYFDCIVVDAPCSGSGLFRRDPHAIEEWSENNVQLCSQRQQRIIADVLPALKQDGILIYSTCSYSREEDEKILDWMAADLNLTTRKLNLKEEWGIIEVASEQHGLYGYRFFPDKVKGEGFFIAVLQKKEGSSFIKPRTKKTGLDKISKTEEGLLKPWLKEDKNRVLFKQGDDIIAIPAAFEMDLVILQSALYIKKAGIKIGKLAGRDFVPDHQLALSSLIAPDTVSIPLNREQAIQYLRRDEVQLSTGAIRGWALVTYQGQNLGWIKALGNRINNYYPKEWRILKQAPL
jgi:16S rRNA C967 or C1407 C5-methylase (RsmB/RsmF family)/NOL1/NOP2/fmu family ribosome biogenesis protein